MPLNKSLTYEEIQKLNNCSIKTVHEDIKYMHLHWNHIIEFNLTKYHIKSNNNSVYDLMMLKSIVFHNEIKVKLLLSVFLHPNLDIPKHSELLHYSESHLRRQIPSINQYLGQFSSEIVYNKDQSGYTLESNNEIATCFMLAHLIKTSSNNQISPDLLQDQSQYQKNFFSNYSWFIPESIKTDTKRLYGVILKRLEQGYYTDDKINILRNTYNKHYENRDIFYEFAKSYQSYYQRNLKKEEIDMIIDILALTATEAELSPFKIDNYMNRYDYFYESLKRESPYMAKLVESTIENFRTKYVINFENHLSELVFHFFTNIDGLRAFKKFVIGVHSDFGTNHAHSLLLSIQKNFPDQTFLIYNPEQHYNFVISTYDSIINVDKDRIVKVSDYISVTDIQNIYSYIYLKHDDSTKI